MDPRTSSICRARRRHSAIGLTRKKRDEVQALARAFVSARQRMIEAYGDPHHAVWIIHSPRRLVEERRSAGTLVQPGLTSHYSKLAFESGLAALKGSWQKTLLRVGEFIVGDERLADGERRWLRYVLKSPSLLQATIDDRPFCLVEPWSAPNEAALRRRLRRLVVRHAPIRPRPPKTAWVELDTNCYRTFTRAEDRHFRGAWLSMTGTVKGRRINIPLAGRSLGEFRPRTEKQNSKPGLRVSLDGDRVVITAIERITPPQATGGVGAGLDKGYRTLLTLVTGEPESARGYGENAHRTIAAVAEAQAVRKKARGRLVAHERSLRNTDAPKAKRVRRNCLKRSKIDRRSRAETARLKQEIGVALNTMFHSHAELGTLYVEALDFLGKRLSRDMNRRLGRWMKGYLQRSLAYKAQLHGVQLQVVNAAYTSQTCPPCGYPSSANRAGERFECRGCSYMADADAVAATNVLKRGSDGAITRWTSKEEVYRILEARWRSALTGGAWGSNAPRTGGWQEPRRTVATRQASEAVRVGGTGHLWAPARGARP